METKDLMKPRQTARDIEDRAKDYSRTISALYQSEAHKGFLTGAIAERENTLGFAEWCSIEGWDYYHKPKHWFKQKQDKYYTTAQLFTLYLATKKQ